MSAVDYRSVRRVDLAGAVSPFGREAPEFSPVLGLTV